MASPTFPPSGQYIESIRKSCKELAQKCCIETPVDKIDNFLLKRLNKEEYLKHSQNHGTSALPLKFENVEAEINILSILAVCNTLSGYRLALHEATGRGAYQTILAFIMAVYLEDESLFEAKHLKEFNPERIAKFIGLSGGGNDITGHSLLYQERPVEPTTGNTTTTDIPGVTLTEGYRGGKVSECIDVLSQVLVSTGEALEQIKFKTLGEFVVHALEQSRGCFEKTKSEHDFTDKFVEIIVRSIPAFQDMAVVDGLDVYVFKKALFLAHILRLRYGKEPETIFTPPTDNLPVFCDNLIPTMLYQLGLLEFSNCTCSSTLQNDGLGPKLDEKDLNNNDDNLVEGVELNKQDAYRVRAGAVNLAYDITKRARELGNKKTQQNEEDKESIEWLKNMTEVDLDGYLWGGLAKHDKVLKRAPRMVELKTCFY